MTENLRGQTDEKVRLAQKLREERHYIAKEATHQNPIIKNKTQEEILAESNTYDKLRNLPRK